MNPPNSTNGDKKGAPDRGVVLAFDRNSGQRQLRTLDERNVPLGHTARFVGGHPIVFPGQPYPVQLPYMERVVKALDARENALLEAPTGVGKTLGLICSANQWLEDEKKTHFERMQAFAFTNDDATQGDSVKEDQMPQPKTAFEAKGSSVNIPQPTRKSETKTGHKCQFFL